MAPNGNNERQPGVSAAGPGIVVHSVHKVDNPFALLMGNASAVGLEDFLAERGIPGRMSGGGSAYGSSPSLGGHNNNSSSNSSNGGSIESLPGNGVGPVPRRTSKPSNAAGLQPLAQRRSVGAGLGKTSASGDDRGDTLADILRAQEVRLQTVRNSMQQEIGQLEKENTTLKQENSVLKEANAALQKQIAELQQLGASNEVGGSSRQRSTTTTATTHFSHSQSEASAIVQQQQHKIESLQATINELTSSYEHKLAAMARIASMSHTTGPSPMQSPSAMPVAASLVAAVSASPLTLNHPTAVSKQQQLSNKTSPGATPHVPSEAAPSPSADDESKAAAKSVVAKAEAPSPSLLTQTTEAESDHPSSSSPSSVLRISTVRGGVSVPHISPATEAAANEAFIINVSEISSSAALLSLPPSSPPPQIALPEIPSHAAAARTETPTYAAAAPRTLRATSSLPMPASPPASTPAPPPIITRKPTVLGSSPSASPVVVPSTPALPASLVSSPTSPASAVVSPVSPTASAGVPPPRTQKPKPPIPNRVPRTGSPTTAAFGDV